MPGMSETTGVSEPLFHSSAEIHVAAPPETVYEVISDLPRSGEWSPECEGGEWVAGEPARVGAVFEGKNSRSPDVVAWAPVVRGTWTTRAEVVAAEPGRTFRWAMLTKAGERQDSVWGYDIRPADGGSVLTHHFRMGAPTEGIRSITSGMDEAEKRRFFREWREKVAADLTTTLRRVKAVVEQQ